MTTSPPSPQNSSLQPQNLDDALLPLPGLHEALAYIEKRTAPGASTIDLYDTEDDPDGEPGQNESPLPRRPKPLEVLDGLMILRIYAAAASCDHHLQPGPGLI